LIDLPPLQEKKSAKSCEWKEEGNQIMADILFMEGGSRKIKRKLLVVNVGDSTIYILSLSV
jgi:serine/threonine protein phosphatase PrpC